MQTITSPHLLEALTDVARSIVSKDLVPAVAGPMPHAAPAELPATRREGAAAAYFPACINRIFGRDNTKPASPALPETFVALSERAGKPLWIPDDVRGLCCSTPWSSKGYKRGQTWMSEQMSDALWRWSDGGKLPVVVDAASCTLGLKDDILEHLDDERKDRLKRDHHHRFDRLVQRSSALTAAFTKRFPKSLSIPLVRRRTLASVRRSSKSPARWLTALKFLWERLVAELLATAACCIPSWFTPPHATHSYKSRAPGTTPASFLQIGLASWVCAKLPAECMSRSFTCSRN